MLVVMLTQEAARFAVIRFANERVRADMDAVWEATHKTAAPRSEPPHPTPSGPPSPARFPERVLLYIPVGS